MLAGSPSSATMRVLSSDRETTLQQLQHGVSSQDGVWFPEALAPIMDKPGIVRTRARIEDLQRERDDINAFHKRWPARDGRFQYTGRPYKHVHDNRRLETGDIIELTQSQAESWRDRFVPVSEGMPLTDLTARPPLQQTEDMNA